MCIALEWKDGTAKCWFTGCMQRFRIHWHLLGCSSPMNLTHRAGSSVLKATEAAQLEWQNCSKVWKEAWRVLEGRCEWKEHTAEANSQSVPRWMRSKSRRMCKPERKVIWCHLLQNPIKCLFVVSGCGIFMPITDSFLCAWKTACNSQAPSTVTEYFECHLLSM